MASILFSLLLCLLFCIALAGHRHAMVLQRWRHVSIPRHVAGPSAKHRPVLLKRLRLRHCMLAIRRLGVTSRYILPGRCHPSATDAIAH